ncbi:hypothetical protein [Pseudoalteromonas luteoviolacea]|nr:hypothetical protein [Pseudoalteromonas luteoviolacea]
MSTRNIVFLCTANSARSIMAESIFNYLNPNEFSVYSAGSKSSGMVNKYALGFLDSKRIPTEGLTSKSLEQLPFELKEDDLVVAVCGGAIDDVCPLPNFKAQVLRLILPDPAVPNSSEQESTKFFAEVGNYLYESLPKLLEMLRDNEPLSQINDYFAQAEKPTLA